MTASEECEAADVELQTLRAEIESLRARHAAVCEELQEAQDWLGVQQGEEEQLKDEMEQLSAQLHNLVRSLTSCSDSAASDRLLAARRRLQILRWKARRC